MSNYIMSGCHGINEPCSGNIVTPRGGTTRYSPESSSSLEYRGGVQRPLLDHHNTPHVQPNPPDYARKKTVLNAVLPLIMAPQKGKAPTKGAKQIVIENISTVDFYRNMAVGAFLFHAVVVAILFMDAVSVFTVVMNLFVAFIYFACYQIMNYVSRPKYGENSQLIDPGLDLNMEGGMGEHVKDIVILTSITQIASTFSNYFWLLLLLLPIRAFWLIWVNFLGPWFFQEAPQDSEQDEKKRKKMERKMKRYQQ